MPASPRPEARSRSHCPTRDVTGVTSTRNCVYFAFKPFLNAAAYVRPPRWGGGVYPVELRDPRRATMPSSTTMHFHEQQSISGLAWDSSSTSSHIHEIQELRGSEP